MSVRLPQRRSPPTADEGVQDEDGTSREPCKKHKSKRSQPNESSLVSIFECPVCFDFVLPPILQCESGHLVCASCRPHLNNVCPTCRGALGTIRNLALEKIAEFTNFPCKHAQAGCTATLPAKEKLSHETQCCFRPYGCPCPESGCKWLGKKELVVQHLAEAHPSVTTLHGDDIIFLATDLGVDISMDWVMLQSCFGQYFLLSLQKVHKKPDVLYYIQVMILGSRKEAEMFSYKVELHRNGRRLTFESVPRSLDDLGPNDTAFRNDCLHFDSALATFFIDRQHHHMSITIQISPHEKAVGLICKRKPRR